MHCNLNFALVFIANALLCINSFGQDSLLISEVIITANRFEQDMELSTKPISIISQKMMRQSTYTNLAQVLEEQIGIYSVGSTQNPGSNLSLFIRGGNSNHYLILIDGQRITDPSTVNRSIDLSEISLVNIDHIEIMNGASSVMYGSGAIGGVVNLVTKSKEADGLGLRYDLNTGIFADSSFDVSNDLRINYKFGHWNIEAGLYSRDVNGMNATIDTLGENNPIKPDNDDFDKEDYYFRTDYIGHKLSANIQYKKTGQTADIDNGAYSDDDNARLKFDRKYLNYAAKYSLSNQLKVSFKGSVSDIERKSSFLPSIVDVMGNTDETTSINEYFADESIQELLLQYSKKNLTVTGGLGLESSSMNAELSYQSPFFNFNSSLIDVNPQFTQRNAWLSGEKHFIRNDQFTSFNLGFRLNDHTDYNTTVTYQLGVKRQWNTSCSSSLEYATGYNTPSLYQVYAPDMDITSGIMLGNPHLTPEKSTTIALNLAYRVPSSHELLLSIFRSRITDLIEYVYLWDASKNIDNLGYEDYRGSSYLNVGGYTSHGMTLSGYLDLTSKFRIKGNLNLIQANISDNKTVIDRSHVRDNWVQVFSDGRFVTEQESESTTLPRRPINGMISLSYMANSKFSSSLQYRYIGSRNDVIYDALNGPFGALGRVSLENYGLMKLSMNYEVGEALNFSFSIDNLLDKDYQEILGFTTTGRSFYLKTSLSL